MISPQLLHLRELVNKLTYDGDNLALDKALAEIDLVIYNIRQDCFAPAREFFRQKSLDNIQKHQSTNMDWSAILSDISAGLTKESKSEDHSSSNSDIDF